MPRAARKAESGKRDARSTLAKHRLSVLKLAREPGNVAEACRQRELDRTSFYEWKQCFQTQGFEGLKDLPPIHKSRPQTTSPETVARVKELVLGHPAYGYNRLQAMLTREDCQTAALKTNAMAAKLNAMKLRKVATLVRDTATPTLTDYAFPNTHSRRIRANNHWNALSRDARRRIWVVGAFPDGQSALMPVAAHLPHTAVT